MAIVLCLAGYGTYALYNPTRASRAPVGGQGPHPSGTPGPNTLQVQVIAQQWQFTYRFPQYGDVETFALALPAHRNIEFQVTSLDVVHSFWAYQLGVKADAVPGANNIAYVTTHGPTSFSIRCAELCGVWHGAMDATGTVLGRAGFARWITAQRLHNAPATHFLPPYARSYFPEPTGRAGLTDLQVTPGERAARSTPTGGSTGPSFWRRGNIVIAFVLAVIGFAIGWWIGDRIGAHLSYIEDMGQNDVAILIGFAGATIGWLGGSRLSGIPRPPQLGAPASDGHDRHARRGASRYLCLCTDHKVIGLQYLAGIGVFFFIGGLNAMLIRTELLSPPRRCSRPASTSPSSPFTAR